MRVKQVVFAVTAAVSSLANAQQMAWEKCGGQGIAHSKLLTGTKDADKGVGWTGPTSCVSGYVCTSLNDWYSQCVPGSTTRSTTASSSKTSDTPVEPATTLVTSTSTKPTSKPTTATSGTAPASTGIEYLISFGDSYSQTGFDPTLSLASSSNPLGNPSFPGYTTSGGPNWIGYYATQFNSSPVYSYNFASGGATTDANLVTPFMPTVLSFVDQVNLYLKSSKTAGFTKWNGDNSVFAVWIGVNDVGNAWGKPNWSTLIGQIMDQYFNQTQTLYNSGARRFLFLTTPPIERTPSVQSGGDANVKAEGAAVKQYNDALKARVAKFAAANPQAKTYVVDTTVPFTKALDNPKEYGADNATCYDESGTKCLWWNDYHPGQAIHKLVAEAVSVALLNNQFVLKNDGVHSSTFTPP
ncbi:hypothetical protein Q7P35_004673 [Cladosporium inversicolor]